MVLDEPLSLSHEQKIVGLNTHHGMHMAAKVATSVTRLGEFSPIG
jgi:hypothetical protein